MHVTALVCKLPHLGLQALAFGNVQHRHVTFHEAHHVVVVHVRDLSDSHLKIEKYNEARSIYQQISGAAKGGADSAGYSIITKSCRLEGLG